MISQERGHRGSRLVASYIFFVGKLLGDGAAYVVQSTEMRIAQAARRTRVTQPWPPWSSAKAACGTARNADGERTHLFERVLDGIESSLSARLILVGGAAADADPTDMHLALGHDRQSASESNDSGNQCKSWYHAPFEILAVGQFLNAARGKRKSC